MSLLRRLMDMRVPILSFNDNHIREYSIALQREMSRFANLCKRVADAADELEDENLDDPINTLEDMAFLLGVGIDLSASVDAIEQIQAASDALGG